MIFFLQNIFLSVDFGVKYFTTIFFSYSYSIIFISFISFVVVWTVYLNANTMAIQMKTICHANKQPDVCLTWRSPAAWAWRLHQSWCPAHSAQTESRCRTAGCPEMCRHPHACDPEHKEEHTHLTREPLETTQHHSCRLRW